MKPPVRRGEKIPTLKGIGCGARRLRCSQRELRVGDFAEDDGAGGAGGGGEVGGAMVKGFVGEESEGVGFFGLFRDVEFFGGEDFD